MTDFKVVATELDSAASGFQQLSSAAEQLAGRLSSISLGAGDFGRLPGQGGLYHAYRQNQRECKSALKEVGSSLEGVSQGLSDTASQYSEMERKAIETIDTYFSEI